MSNQTGQAAAGIPPLFKADKGTITFAALPDGKVRLTYASWDDAKVVPAKQVLELCWGRQGVEARIVPKVQQPEPDVDPFYIPDDPPAPFHCPAAKGCKSDVDCSDTRCLPFSAGKTSTIAAPSLTGAIVDHEHLAKLVEAMAADLERSGADFIQPFIGKREIEAFRALLTVDAIGLDENGDLTGFSIGPEGKITQKEPEPSPPTSEDLGE